MQRLSTVLSTVGLLSSLVAQPVLNYEQLFSVAEGTEFTINTSDYLEPGVGGENATWDFSELTVRSFRTEVHEAPAFGVSGQFFPDATIAISWGNERSRYLLDDPAVGALDVGEAYGTNYTVYEDPALLLPLTVEYLDSWSDLFNGSAGNDFGEFCDIDGTITGEADGWGTLLMPYGTISDVTRLQITIQYTRSCTTGNSTTTETYDMYYDQQQAVPVLQTRELFVSFDGGPDEFLDHYIEWLGQPGASVAQYTAAAPFTVFPNPTHGTVKIDAPQALRVDLHDAHGRLVRTGPLANGTAVLDLTGLPASVYLASVTDREGKRRQQRIVVE